MRSAVLVAALAFRPMQRGRRRSVGAVRGLGTVVFSLLDRRRERADRRIQPA